MEEIKKCPKCGADMYLEEYCQNTEKADLDSSYIGKWECEECSHEQQKL